MSSADASRDEIFIRWQNEFGAALRRTAASYARTASEQDDLTQQTALALWMAIPSFRDECSERTFVLRIAHNQGVQFSIRERARRAHAYDSSHTIIDERPDPETAVEGARRRARLYDAIRTLPIGQRQVLTLALEGISHLEIAAVLGVTVNTVDVRLSRARDALRTQLGGST